MLYDTLRRHCPDAVLHVLALSPQCERTLGRLALPGLTVTPLAELEAADPALLAVKPTRSVVEYYFTLSPCWPLHLFRRQSDLDLLTYLDADMALFSDPSPALEEMATRSVGMVGHRFSQATKANVIYGIYNVGWLSYRRTPEGLDCLNWWRDRCLEWCHDRLEDDRFGDQKYLDRWPDLFSGARELDHKGVNVAPWNVDRFALSVRDGQVFVDNDPLICYHFQGVKPLIGRWWGLGLCPSRAHLTSVLRDWVYRPYLRHLQGTVSRLHGQDSRQAAGLRRKGMRRWLGLVRTLARGDVLKAPV